jgi:hypothetical protein
MKKFICIGNGWTSICEYGPLFISNVIDGGNDIKVIDELEVGDIITIFDDLLGEDVKITRIK